MEIHHSWQGIVPDLQHTIACMPTYANTYQKETMPGVKLLLMFPSIGSGHQRTQQKKTCYAGVNYNLRYKWDSTMGGTFAKVYIRKINESKTTTINNNDKNIFGYGIYGIASGDDVDIDGKLVDNDTYFYT